MILKKHEFKALLQKIAKRRAKATAKGIEIGTRLASGERKRYKTRHDTQNALNRKIGPVFSIKRLKKILKDKQTAYIRARDGEFCRSCPYAFPGQQPNYGYASCHIIPANEGQASKWCLLNQFWGCARCNAYENNYRARWATVIYPKMFGVNFLDFLRQIADTTFQPRRPEFEMMIAEVDAQHAALNKP